MNLTHLRDLDQRATQGPNVIVRAAVCGHHHDDTCIGCQGSRDWTNQQLDELRAEIANLRNSVPAILEAVEALEDIAHQAQTRIEDGDEMGARIWRIALGDILAEARAALATINKEPSDG